MVTKKGIITRSYLKEIFNFQKEYQYFLKRSEIKGNGQARFNPDYMSLAL